MTLNLLRTHIFALGAPLVVMACLLTSGSYANEVNHYTAHRQQELKHNNRAKAKIIINAPMDVVWKSVAEYRRRDPERISAKIVSESRYSRVLEEQFAIPTIFGTAACLLSLTEIPIQRIDFRLIQSEELKAMEGSWILTPSDNGESTTLELTSYMETEMPLPRLVINNIVKRKLDKRLEAVKAIASSMKVSCGKQSM